jgi:hypothetical protein
MPKSVLAAAFGSGASQDATKLTIQKGSLNGLIANSNNSTESLLVALLLHCSRKLLIGDLDLDLDREIAVELSPATTVSRQGVEFTQNMFVVIVQKPFVATSINPNDY